MKRKPNVEKPTEKPEDKTFQELIAEQHALIMNNREHLLRQREVLIKNLEAANKINAAMKKQFEEADTKRRRLGNEWPKMQARTYSYAELYQMSDDYGNIDPLRSVVMRMVLKAQETKILERFNGDTSKAKFWSPTKEWGNLELITEEYPTPKVVIGKQPVVSKGVATELNGFIKSHMQ